MSVVSAIVEDRTRSGLIESAGMWRHRDCGRIGKHSANGRGTDARMEDGGREEVGSWQKAVRHMARSLHRLPL